MSIQSNYGASMLLALFSLFLFSGCKRESGVVETKLSIWERPHYETAGESPMILYVVYGSFTNEVRLSGAQYRTAGIPKGVTLKKFSRSERPSLPFTDGDIGNLFQAQDAALFAQVENAPECMVIQGEVADSDNLNYLRDCIGVVTYFMDHGGVAVADVLQIKLFGATEWRDDFFEPAQPKVLRHVTILFSEEEQGGGRWYHTRGMRKFGRPDLSLRNVPAQYQEPAIDLCERFIQLQALGGHIPEGQGITMKALPPGLVARRQGSFDDPDFNNVHVEIQFPPEP